MRATCMAKPPTQCPTTCIFTCFPCNSMILFVAAGTSNLPISSIVKLFEGFKGCNLGYNNHTSCLSSSNVLIRSFGSVGNQ